MHNRASDPGRRSCVGAASYSSPSLYNSQAHNPFYAGFGNNSHDDMAYTEAGVPPSRIFVINPQGEIRRGGGTYCWASYPRLLELAQQVYGTPPPVFHTPLRYPHPFHTSSSRSRWRSLAGAAAAEAAGMGRADEPDPPHELRDTPPDIPPRGWEVARGCRVTFRPFRQTSSLTVPPQVFPPLDAAVRGGTEAVGAAAKLEADEPVDDEFKSFNFWRVPPRSLERQSSPSSRRGGGAV